MQNDFLHYILFLLILYLGGTLGISLILAAFLKKLSDPAFPEGLLNAGKWIGYLERALYISLILINEISLIGFVLTIKAIYRFGDIQADNSLKMKLSEYFLIGSMASLLLTIIWTNSLTATATYILPNLSPFLNR